MSMISTSTRNTTATNTRNTKSMRDTMGNALDERRYESDFEIVLQTVVQTAVETAITTLLNLLPVNGQMIQINTIVRSSENVKVEEKSVWCCPQEDTNRELQETQTEVISKDVKQVHEVYTVSESTEEEKYGFAKEMNMNLDIATDEIITFKKKRKSRKSKKFKEVTKYSDFDVDKKHIQVEGEMKRDNFTVGVTKMKKEQETRRSKTCKNIDEKAKVPRKRKYKKRREKAKSQRNETCNESKEGETTVDSTKQHRELPAPKLATEFYTLYEITDFKKRKKRLKLGYPDS